MLCKSSAVQSLWTENSYDSLLTFYVRWLGNAVQCTQVKCQTLLNKKELCVKITVASQKNDAHTPLQSAFLWHHLWISWIELSWLISIVSTLAFGGNGKRLFHIMSQCITMRNQNENDKPSENYHLNLQPPFHTQKNPKTNKKIQVFIFFNSQLQYSIICSIIWIDMDVNLEEIDNH